MKPLILFLLSGFCALSSLAFDGNVSEWKGFTRYDFTCEGRDAIVVVPRNAAPGNPWIVRPAFFGAFANADEGLLHRGWHVAYFDVTHFYGNHQGQQLFSSFYRKMVDQYGLAPQVVLEGLSRGGLFSLSWAVNNVDKVAALYLDAPVCDVRSWPGRRQTDLWNDMLRGYEITDGEADEYSNRFLRSIERLAEAGTPILLVSGDADTTVPYEANGKRVKDCIEAAGGTLQLILKPGGDHHPHGLQDSTVIVDFVDRYAPAQRDHRYVNPRNGLSRSHRLFTTQKRGRVAFLGGSITEMKGWHNRVMEELQRRFPNTQFEFIEAGIGSTGSTPGAFRMEKDVLSGGPVDLLFVEAAVNDHTNHFGPVQQLRGMEGEVRRALLSNPSMDVVMLHFIYDPFIPMIERGETPEVVQTHERVADYYGIPSINLIREVGERMQQGQFTWETFGGTHPAPFGHSIYAAAISSLFDRCWSANGTHRYAAIPHTIPDSPLDPFSYFRGRLVDVKQATLKKGWSYTPSWKPRMKTGTRRQFVEIPAVETTVAGATLEFAFKGTAVGLFLTTGPDAGILEYSVDGAKFKTLDPFTEWSSQLYLPWLYVLEDELPDTPHTLVLRMSKRHHPQSIGTACQIFYFAVNGER